MQWLLQKFCESSCFYFPSWLPNGHLHLTCTRQWKLFWEIWYNNCYKSFANFPVSHPPSSYSRTALFWLFWKTVNPPPKLVGFQLTFIQLSYIFFSWNASTYLNQTTKIWPSNSDLNHLIHLLVVMIKIFLLLKHKDSFGKSENLSKIFFAEILVFDHDYEGKSSSRNGLLWISFIYFL